MMPFPGLKLRFWRMVGNQSFDPRHKLLKNFVTFVWNKRTNFAPSIMLYRVFYWSLCSQFRAYKEAVLSVTYNILSHGGTKIDFEMFLSFL